ncbi:MAG: lipid IV(A) 3-deoxy-D-manno-octulosonic acid transferase [Dechloromonas sp.]|nr:lipid IV(A) 3-deoxy-D-manno-octulosonic acid transferase [Dechloromonas sp.]
MWRYLYSALLYLLTPAIACRLLWRGRRQPEYWQHLAERLGFYPKRPAAPVLWVHAVSVGETRAAQPLIEALQRRWPGYRILLTGMTPTGRAAGAEVYGDGLDQVYLPYDYPPAVDRFLRHFSPVFGVLMETEIWPNLLAACQRRQVPVVLANARLSARSARGYQRFSALLRPAFAALAGAAAQSAADAERLQALGVGAVDVCGNLKFDVSPPADKLALGAQWRLALAGRAVWLAASTRQGEEALILAAWRQLALRDSLLVIVPRHPQRFAEVADLLVNEGIPFARRSDRLPQPADAVWLGDSMGEMVAYYALAELAFIGGSLAPLGGQNLIEAAACACPVLLGPHTFNFQRASEDAVAAGAARRVADASELLRAVNALLTDKKATALMRTAAVDYAATHRGATLRTVSFIAQRALPAAH